MKEFERIAQKNTSIRVVESASPARFAIEAGSGVGDVTWEMSEPAANILLTNLDADARTKVGNAMGSNLETFCRALLASFGVKTEAELFDAAVKDLYLVASPQQPD